MLRNLNLSEDHDEVNILLLGEVGVGKSTFINAFSNYVTFPTLSHAMDHNPKIVIPSEFTVTDRNRRECVIKTGKHSENSTQSCRSYVYSIKNTIVRFIDTPGFGSCNSVIQDNVNFQRILYFISKLKHLNAICLLLKPNSAKLKVFFEYFIKQLLFKLEKSAVKNIVFIFTNTRSTLYRPGETIFTLKKLLANFKGANIPCEKQNIFCFDNEAFRFLAALQDKVLFAETDINNFYQSWTRSYEACAWFFMYIFGSKGNTGLIPHEIKNTIAINNARQLIIQLSRPLADITQLIQESTRNLSQHEQILKNVSTNLDQLKTKMNVSTTNLKITKLHYSVTVCASSKCAKIQQINGEKTLCFPQKCHFPCLLKKISKEVIGSPELINCAVMKAGKCVICNCSYQMHMHLNYEMEKIQNELIYDHISNSQIVSKEKSLQELQNSTGELSKRLSELQKEKEILIKTTVKLACFLRMYALLLCNDACEVYLIFLIERDKANLELTKHMRNVLLEYQSEKNVITNAISKSYAENCVITADEITSKIQHLYSLKIFGPKIKEMHQSQDFCRMKDTLQDEFVFDVKLGNSCNNDNSRLSSYSEPGPSYRLPIINNSPRIYMQQNSTGRIDLTILPPQSVTVDRNKYVWKKK